MVSDALFEFSAMSGQDLSGGQSAAGTNVIDLGSAEDREIGRGDPVKFAFVVTETFQATSNDGTLTISVVKDSALPIDGSSVELVSSEAIAEADLVKGLYKELFVPAGVNLDQYLGVYYTKGGTAENWTAGKIVAFPTK